jgi:hypothetical protein
MRPIACAFGSALLLLGLLGCEELNKALNGPDGADAGSTEAASTADGGPKGTVGGACATEEQSQTSLCAAISTCPSVTVDTQAMPHCGFRVRNGVADLVCACGGAICPMGTYNTCAEAKALLDEQTEQGVCVQVADGRCNGGATTTPSASPTSTANPACDRQCVRDCGGGEACSAVCNCS